MINHGTTSGYYAHRRLKERACKDCREAIREYSKKYREEVGPNRDRRSDKIRRQALAVLRDRHREEYEALVEEIRMAGSTWTPPQSVGTE